MSSHSPVLVEDSESVSLALPHDPDFPPLSVPSPLHHALAWVSDTVQTLEVDPLRNGLRLVVLGGMATAVKRGVDLLWDAVVDRAPLPAMVVPRPPADGRPHRLGSGLTLTAHIEQHDPAYDWMMAWLAQPQLQHKARNFEVDTRTAQNRIGRRQEWDEEAVMLLPNFGKWAATARA